jgi:PIN domain nuclease of toxin-antitoxin system
LAPQQLSAKATHAINAGRTESTLACSDIVLWEVAMLAAKKRIIVPVAIDEFLEELLQALRLQVLPISPSIAARSQKRVFEHGDPADRLIASTAMEYAVPLISADRSLARFAGLEVLW